MTDSCATCGVIGDVEFGSHKNGFPQYDSPLPAAVGLLVEVASNASGGRGDVLYRCPSCGLYFKCELDYEFIVPGTEDSATLHRITATEAAALLREIQGNRLVTHRTHGLPDGTRANEGFEFYVEWRDSPPQLRIPGVQRGPDVCIPDSEPQREWLDTRRDLLVAEWDCVWRFLSDETAVAFTAMLVGFASD